MFRRFCLFTIASIYFLILVGGIVRSTGSGMGCPDWPKCFGQWVPPFSESELPTDYADVLAQKRKDKNIKLTALFSNLGLQNLLPTDESEEHLYQLTHFNVEKAWIEYVNRVIGVLIGLFVIITMLLSFKYWSVKKSISILSILSFVLIVFQGWLGSIVVSTHLFPGLITFHMILALVIVTILIIAYKLAEPITEEAKTNYSPLLSKLLILSILLMTVQLVLGTKIREIIDYSVNYLHVVIGSDFTDSIGLRFYIHRSFSILILASHVWMLYLLYKWNKKDIRFYILLSFVLIEILSGAILSYFALPPFFQPIHLLFANLIIGYQVYLLIDTSSFFNKKESEIRFI